MTLYSSYLPSAERVIILYIFDSYYEYFASFKSIQEPHSMLLKRTVLD